MNLVNADRAGVNITPFPLIDPLSVSPGVSVRIPDQGGGFFAVLTVEGKWITLHPQGTVSINELEFVMRVLDHSGDE